MAEVERYQLSSDAAQRYEQNAVPRLMKPHTEAMFDHVSLLKSERILDVACGTGVVTHVAVERFPSIASIVGVDLNPAMLDIARAHTPATDIPIEWRQGDMCALPFPDDSFDVVVCQHGLQYATDKLAAFKDMKRILVPGGRLIFTVWSRPHRDNAALADALRRHVHAEAAKPCLAPFAWSGADTIRKLVDKAGFQDIQMDVIESTSRRASSTNAVQAFVEGYTSRASFAPFADAIASALSELKQDVSATLQPYRVGAEFVMTSKAHLVQAQA